MKRQFLSEISEKIDNLMLDFSQLFNSGPTRARGSGARAFRAFGIFGPSRARAFGLFSTGQKKARNFGLGPEPDPSLLTTLHPNFKIPSSVQSV